MLNSFTFTGVITKTAVAKQNTEAAVPVTARDVKRWIRSGLIVPVDALEHRPGWRDHRQVWSGVVEGWRVTFCPDGREIDMTTLRVRALPGGAIN